MISNSIFVFYFDVKAPRRLIVRVTDSPGCIITSIAFNVFDSLNCASLSSSSLSFDSSVVFDSGLLSL